MTTDLQDTIQALEIRVKHLTNELALTRQEFDQSLYNYFHIFSNMEKIVVDRTQELHAMQNVLTIKGKELEIMLDNTPAMVFYRDTHQKYIRLNRKYAETLGVCIKDLIGKTHLEVFPGSRNSFLHDDTQVIESGGSLVKHHTFMETDQGAAPILLDKIPHKDNDGKVIGVIGFVMDLTEIQQAEEEKRKLQEKVARAEKMEAIGLLAGGFAHDGNNILGGIMGFIQLAMMNLDSNDPSRRFLESAMESAYKMGDMVQDLLTMARRGVSTTEILNLNVVVDAYLNSSVHRMAVKSHPEIQFASELDPDLLNLEGKVAHLEKTVMNLVSNAIESMENGGIVAVSTYNQHLETPIQDFGLEVQPGDFVVLRVADTGSGISDTDRVRIFEPFYTKKAMGRKSGSGLGLAVVYGAVKDHNGAIVIESAPGKGTTMELFFPATRAVAAIHKSGLFEQTHQGIGQKILVVDDMESQRQIAMEILARTGYQVNSVASGEECLEYLKTHTVDLLVLDMIMPGLDGLETYRGVLEMHPGQKAIIASGFAETGRVQEALQLGASAFIKKPYFLEKLTQAVEKALR